MMEGLNVGNIHFNIVPTYTNPGYNITLARMAKDSILYLKGV